MRGCLAIVLIIVGVIFGLTVPLSPISLLPAAFLIGIGVSLLVSGGQ
jgi:hypothetical protein